MGKMKTTLRIVIIVVLVCIALLTTVCSSEASLTRGYWSKASPIVENHIEKGSRPFAEVWIEAIPAIQSGDNVAYEKLFLAVREYYPYVGDAILELTELNPPTNATAKWQLLQLEAWSLRTEALYMYMNCWDYNSGTLIGTDKDLIAADEKFWESQAVSKEADKLLAEMLRK